MPADANIAIVVPTMANSMIVPIFLKKYFFSMLNPDSNIIGGSRNSMNNLLK